MGGTGDPPVPVGDPPTGIVCRLQREKAQTKICAYTPFRPASRRTAQASGLCYPKLNLKTRPRVFAKINFRNDGVRPERRFSTRHVGGSQQVRAMSEAGAPRGRP